MSESVQLLVERLHAKRSGNGWKAKCPVHDDREPSISIREGSDGRALIKCHAGCQTNDILAAIDLKPRDLFVSGKNDSEPPKQTLSRKTNDQNSQQFDWQSCVDALSEEDLVRLGNQRWWSRAFCVWLRDEKKIGLHKGHFAFPMERDGKIVAAKYKWGPGPNDWGAYPTEQGTACFILGDPKRARNIHLDESQWDICSLADRTDWFRDAENHAFIATPGSGNAKMVKGLIPAGASMLAWPQNDASGEKWLHDLVRYADARIAKAIVPMPHKDLGDWCKAGASAEAIYNAWWRNELVYEPSRPADLGLVLEKICEFLRRHVVFSSPAQLIAIALWIVHTWRLDAFDYTPYLHLWSPEKRCGKTKLLDCLELLVANPWRAVSPSEAVLYRKIELDQPTLLLDEVDTIFSGNKDERKEPLRALLNAGFERKAKVPRCVGQGSSYRIQEFAIFCPKAFAGIGRLPDTIGDRCVPIRLIRRSREEAIERFRKRNAEAATLEIRESLASWAQQPGLAEELRAAQPETPVELNDRQADICEPLLAVADKAGGEWPGQARHALVELCTNENEEEESIGIRLLSDNRNIFESEGTDRLATQELLDGLVELETDAPWATWWEEDLKKVTPAALRESWRNCLSDTKYKRVSFDCRTTRLLAATCEKISRRVGSVTALSPLEITQQRNMNCTFTYEKRPVFEGFQ